MSPQLPRHSSLTTLAPSAAVHRNLDIMIIPSKCLNAQADLVLLPFMERFELVMQEFFGNEVGHVARREH